YSVVGDAEGCPDIASRELYLLTFIPYVPTEDAVDSYAVGADLTGIVIDNLVIDRKPALPTLISDMEKRGLASHRLYARFPRTPVKQRHGLDFHFSWDECGL